MRTAILKFPLAAVLLCAATLAGAESAPVRLASVVDHRGPAPVQSEARGAQVAASIDSKPDSKRPDWMMLLAGLAVAGWIAQRRLTSPLE